MNIRDLMNSDDLSIERVASGMCACGPTNNLVRLKVESESIYTCVTCLQSAIKIVRIKGKQRNS